MTLNRPSKFNAVTEGMLLELESAFKLFDRDDRIKAIVVTGAGRAFCAGADLEVGFSDLLGDSRGNQSSYRDGFVPRSPCVRIVDALTTRIL